MGFQIPYHFVSNIGNILRKSRIRNYHYKLFTIKTNDRTRTAFSKNSIFPIQTFFSCGKRNISYLNFSKVDKTSEELSYIPSTKEIYFNRLYPEIRAENDPILESIVNASTVEELFDLIKDHLHNEVYCSQVIVTLSFLRKAYEMTATNSTDDKEFIEVVKSHPQFWSTVECVEKSSSLLSDKVLSTILLCLNKFQIAPWDPCLQSAWQDSLSRIGSFSLEALRNWCLATLLPNHCGRLALPAALPAFHRHMDQFQSLADFGMLVTCFATIAPVIHKTGPTARIFIGHVNRLLDTKVLNQDTPLSTLVGILHALYLVARTNASSSAANLKILYLLLNSRHMSDPSCLGYFNVIRKTWETVSEPIGLVRKMEEVSCSFLENVDIQIEHINLLSHVSHSYESSSDRKSQLELHLLRIMDNEPISKIEPHLKQIFRIIRASKISDTKLVDRYWILVLNSLNSHYSHKEQFISFFLDTAQWYMFFNNNLGGTYRSKPFENYVLHAIDKMVDGNWGQTVTNVRFFCRMAAFVLAYGGPQTQNDLLGKLSEIEEQLSIHDIYYLSRGIQLGRHWLNRAQMHYSQRNMGDLLSLLNRRSVALFSSTASNTLSLTTTLLHAAHYRNTEIYGALNLYEIGLKKCETQLSGITARVTRDLVFFLDRFHYLHFKIVDTIIEYVLKQHEHLGPSTIINAYILLFSLGYSSNAIERLAPITLKLLELGEHGLFGLSVLEAALALLYNNRLSIKLVNQIFAIEFLEKLDAEIASCYSKTSYPIRVRRTLMELNRCVCIDMPEAGVPWFHEKYCQEQAHTKAPVSSNFQEDVYDCLVHILGCDKFIKRWALSPYYHLIDFELTLNENGEPVIPSSKTEPNNREEKVALIALGPMYFTVNHGYMRGLKLLRHRQLEILGYRVVGIPYYHWNSLALSTPGAKSNYLKQKLFKQRHA